MGQVNSILRRGADCYFHWCPGCEEMHPLPDRWQFNGNVDCPTFTPSFRHTGIKQHTENGVWCEPWWDRDAQGNAIPWCCHYVITNGQIAYCTDSNHSLAGKTIPIPPLPDHLTDEFLPH